MTGWFERLRSRTAAFSHDLLMIPVAWLLAYWLRFNLGVIPPEFLEGALLALPLVVLVQGAVNWLFGLYRGVWRFASLPDLIRITKAVLAGTALTLFALFILNRMEDIPRSVPALYLLIQMLLLAGPRLLYRWLKDHRLVLRSGQRVLIVGAGRAGEMLARDMLREPGLGYVPIAFVDDKLRRHGGEVQGIPIRGTTEAIADLVDTLEVDLILLAIPSATAKEMQQLVDRCEQAERPFRTVPQLRNLLTGQVSVNQLRPVSIEDLLGRDPVDLDWEAIRRGLANRVILVTGGGGSIGSELCRQIASSRPGRLVVVDNCEFNLYRIDMELRDTHPGLAIEARLLDVTDSIAVQSLFQRERPQIVFHAAAYKHVPMLEYQVRAAIRNNVFGTDLLARAAHQWACEQFVLISTDKAVNPSNVMGATKHVAEILCQAIDQGSDTRFTVVRFGNVLGSAGSVVPLFQRQIERGGPVTVTDPDIERFFMTIPEACQLIMQAAAIGQGGEIFVLDMGEAVKISYLAEQMIRLSGKLPVEDIDIEYIGLRPGEKLYEELFYDSEDMVATSHPKIRIAQRGSGPELAALDGVLQGLERGVQTCDEDALRDEITRLIPQWSSGRGAPAVVLERDAGGQGTPGSAVQGGTGG